MAGGGWDNECWANNAKQQGAGRGRTDGAALALAAADAPHKGVADAGVLRLAQAQLRNEPAHLHPMASFTILCLGAEAGTALWASLNNWRFTALPAGHVLVPLAQDIQGLWPKLTPLQKGHSQSQPPLQGRARQTRAAHQLPPRLGRHRGWQPDGGGKVKALAHGEVVVKGVILCGKKRGGRAAGNVSAAYLCGWWQQLYA